MTLQSKNHPYYGRESEWNRVCEATRETGDYFKPLTRTAREDRKARRRSPLPGSTLALAAIAGLAVGSGYGRRR